MDHPRPTLRCAREDLKLPIPPIDDPLDEIDHPLLAKAAEQFTDDTTRHERIRAIDDEILFKVKVRRWRGAIWTEESLPWLIAAGVREDGSLDDFYASLAVDAQAARARYNAEHAKPLVTGTYCGHLLPNQDDYERYQLEAGTRLIRHLSESVRVLIRASLHDGREHSTGFSTFVLGVQVRADNGHETYVAVRITGSVPDNIIYLVLDLVPGCDRDGWYPNRAFPAAPSTAPNRPGPILWIPRSPALFSVETFGRVRCRRARNQPARTWPPDVDVEGAGMTRQGARRRGEGAPGLVGRGA